MKSLLPKARINAPCTANDSKENSYAVYDTRAPKYSKWALRGAIRERVVKKHLWNGEFGEDGRFARNVGDKATAEVIKRYIQSHRNQELNPQRLELNMMPRPVGG